MNKLIWLFVLLSLSGCSIHKTTSALFAKEVCSCLFVAEVPEASCLPTGEPVFEISSYKIDRENRQVIASKWGRGSRATFISKRLGCVLAGED